MNCNDILKIDGIGNNIKLYAGEKGLNRRIRWIYFADSMWWEEEYNPSDFVRGGELIFAINVAKLYDEQKLISMMEMTNEKLVAGYIMDNNRITDKIIKCANELEMPLLGINENIKLVDFSMTLSRMLLEEKQEQSLDSLFANILYNEELSSEDLMYKSSQYGIDIDKKYRAVYFNMSFNTEDKSEIRKERQNIRDKIRNQLLDFGMDCVLMYMQQNFAVIMFPTDLFDENRTYEICRYMIKSLEDRFKMTVFVGIGNVYSDFTKWKTSFNEAKKAVKFATDENKVVIYSSIGLYSLLTQINDMNYLHEFYVQRLGAILEFDSIKDASLCSTLEMYIKCNGNSNAAADALFIHRNTMRYRLDKIETLLGCKLSDWSVCTELNMAIHVKRYLEIMEKGE